MNTIQTIKNSKTHHSFATFKMQSILIMKRHVRKFYIMISVQRAQNRFSPTAFRCAPAAERGCNGKARTLARTQDNSVSVGQRKLEKSFSGTRYARASSGSRTPQAAYHRKVSLRGAPGVPVARVLPGEVESQLGCR